MSFLPTILQAFSDNAPLWIFSTTVGILLLGFIRRQKLLVQIPGPPNGKWLSGHFRSLGGPNGIKFQEKLLSQYGSTMKLNGPLGEEFIFTADPACMHAVLVKDKAKFDRVKGASLMIRWVFGGGLLALQGEEHRTHRKLLNPVFTMKFLRELMPIFTDIAKRTSEGIKGHLTKAETPSGVVDVFPWATVAALELIGEAGLGYSFNSFTGERNEYNESIKIIVPFFSKLGPFLPILAYLYRLGTPSLRGWVLRHVPFPGFRKLLHARKVQNRLAEEALQARQTLIASGHDLSSEVGRGRDIMTLLMKANEKEGSGFQISRQEMVGHMNVFIFAGHETTSGAISRLLDVLANHQSIQVKLREEIKQYFSEHPGDAYHDDLLDLPYLDAVVRETLRLHEPVVGIRRVCQEDTTVPLTYPINTPSGTITSIPIKKGTRILLSVTMANHSKAIWGERALEFWPERWIGNKLEEVTQPCAHLPGVYSAMMTFGAGHQACIGFKFAIMEIKVMVAQLIQDFKFEPCNEEFAWEPAGVQQPFLKKDPYGPNRLPALPLKVTRL